MKELTPEQAYESLGKPSLKKLEGMARDAEASVKSASNALIRQANVGLVQMYFSVMEWLDTVLDQKEARALLAPVTGNIGKLKAILLDNERITVDGEKAVRYAIVDSYGNALQDLADADSLAIATSIKLTIEDLRQIVSGKDDKVLDAFFDNATKAVERADRLKSVQAEVAEIARVIPQNAFVTIRRGSAEVSIDTKSTKAVYRSRLKELAN